MTNTLVHINIIDFITESGNLLSEITLSCQIFGKKLGTAPVVLINHALTGNSNVADAKEGWWKELIGQNKVVDTNKYTVLCFNIPGNGYDSFLIENYKDFIARL